MLKSELSVVFAAMIRSSPQGMGYCQPLIMRTPSIVTLMKEVGVFPSNPINGSDYLQCVLGLGHTTKSKLETRITEY